MGSPFPTPRTTQGHAHVSAACRACDHLAPLDLRALIEAGRGDTPLIRLPLRCGACGSRDVGVSVSGVAPGYG